MVAHSRVKEVAESLPEEWRTAFIHFVETGEAEKRFLDFLDTDKNGQAATQVMFDETAAAFEGLAAALHRTNQLNPFRSGDKTPDGTIYAGISPDTGEPLYAMPADAPLTYTFNEAARYAKKLNGEKAYGHDDWRVPTKAELNVLFNNRAAIGGFERIDSCTSWYRSASPSDSLHAWGQHFSDGMQDDYDNTLHSSLRLVRRDGPKP